jgi:DNA-binding beta-propeller fold protein YncE
MGAFSGLRPITGGTHMGPFRRVRLIIAITTLGMVGALLPAVAHAQTLLGSLSQLANPNNCVESTTSTSTECQIKDPGLSGTDDVVVSPNGKNVYVVSSSDGAIAEFTRNANGSLTELGCIAESIGTNSTCPNKSATGLAQPQAIAISPDGKNVYVAAEDSREIGDIAEFAVNPDGSLTQLGSGHDCIAENTGQTDSEKSDCSDQSGHGMVFPDALAVSPDGNNVYVGDDAGEAVAELARASDGSLSQTGGAADCIRDARTSSTGADCTSTAGGLSFVTGVAVSPHGDNVYTSGVLNDSTGSIAEFTRNTATGLLTSVGCLGNGDGNCTGVTGVVGITGLAVSPDGNNVYTASEEELGPIAEFSRSGTNGVLMQLPSPNNCIQEQGSTFKCGTQGIGIADGFRLAVSSDGADVYAVAPGAGCGNASACSDIAEFARNAGGSLTQLSSPNGCIQDSNVTGSECPGNENGTGLGGPGLAISPDNANVYVTGDTAVAEFARAIPTLTVSLAGPGNGTVSDGTGAIACQPTCSHAYGIGAKVTLTAVPSAEATFSGWSGGGCSGTGTCQVTMDANTAVTATFNLAPTPPTPPTAPSVSVGAPTVTGPNGAAFSGTVNPDGLSTTAYFQYGTPPNAQGPAGSGPTFTEFTPTQAVGSDFSNHPVSASVSALVPNEVYDVQLVATNSAGTTYGPVETFTTFRNAPPPPPVLGKTVNASPISGVVFIKPPAGKTLGPAGDPSASAAALAKGQGFVPLTEARQIPTGSEIDALHGSLKIVTATGHVGKTQNATLTGGVFKLTQARTGISKGLTNLSLVESAFSGAPTYASCKAKGKKAADEATIASLSSRTLQLLRASAHGKFRTTGRYSSATVRGTVWTIADRCDGTLTHAIRDTVIVDDFVRHVTVILHTGQSYLAKAILRRK